MSSFYRRVIFPNRWRYAAVVAACLVYSFGLALLQPPWYKAEATLAFKNRSMSEQLADTRMSSNPLAIFLEEAPIEQTYELANFVYSVNMANRVIGDRFDELYDPAEYDGLIDFYSKFLEGLGFEYDGELNVVKLSYTYDDPELAAEFCNGFATGLEDFMMERVESTQLSPMLRARLITAREDAIVAEDEVHRVADLYGIPDLLQTPRGWMKSYAEAQERSYKSEAEMRMVLAALKTIREQGSQRDLLKEVPSGVPDTTIMQDLLLGALRFRLALLKAVSNVSGETVAEGSAVESQLAEEIGFLEEYLTEQYRYGLDVEEESLLVMLDETIIKNYLNQAHADMTYERLESLPSLEAEVRPVIRASNVATGTVATIERLLSMVEIGEEHGMEPVKVIDAAEVPYKPLILGWGTLAHVLPTMLFLATLWFALAVRLIDETELEVEAETGEKI